MKNYILANTNYEVVINKETYSALINVATSYYISEIKLLLDNYSGNNEERIFNLVIDTIDIDISIFHTLCSFIPLNMNKNFIKYIKQNNNEKANKILPNSKL